jgi:hypothetical protein
MFVCRRSPAPMPNEEMQLLTCSGCGHTIGRTMKEQGTALRHQVKERLSVRKQQDGIYRMNDLKP